MWGIQPDLATANKILNTNYDNKLLVNNMLLYLVLKEKTYM